MKLRNIALQTKKKKKEKKEADDYDEETYYKEIIRLGLNINPEVIFDEKNIEENEKKIEEQLQKKHPQKIIQNQKNLKIRCHLVP